MAVKGKTKGKTTMPTVEGELVNPYRFGRPSKLTVELLQKARDYVEASDNMNANVLLPTKERLARTLGITRETLDQWKKENSDFSDICKDLDMIQADKAMQNGLMGRYQPAITAIVLSRHGYVRMEQQDITSGGEKLGVEANDNQLAQLIEARTRRSDI
jgi:hypothetical protein